LKLERVRRCVLEGVEIGVERAGTRVGGAETLEIESEMLAA
jgi:hypothetical protein